MPPTPRFAIHDGYAVYRGPVSGDGPLHRHAAFQVAVGNELGDEVAMLDPLGREYRSAALVVAPMAPHRIMAADDLVTYFVDPHCAFADRLRRYGDGVNVAPDLRRLTGGDIGPAAASRELDPRLVEALNMLGDSGIRIPDVSAAVGLSPQRLRALASAQLGLPLARWRVWARLRRAAQCLMAGRSLAEAAVGAGFADQAHLTRQMKEMMGLTPTAVLPLLRQSREAT